MVYVPKVNSFICAEVGAGLPPIPGAEAGRKIVMVFLVFVFGFKKK